MMDRFKISIEGMSCQHCRMSVERALSQIEGITSYRVDLDKGEAVITGNPDRENVLQAINQLGYRASFMS